MGLSSEDEEDATKARLSTLSSALDGHREAAASKPGPSGASPPEGMGQAIGLGFRVMTEFVAAVLVAGVIGWVVDRWLGTSPGALILFIGLGTAAGFWTVYRMAATPPGPRGGGPRD